ncbi:hypothetical protein KIPB_002965, partial [Kipferlia bialata]|eukprot:g2965.t1
MRLVGRRRTSADKSHF